MDFGKLAKRGPVPRRRRASVQREQGFTLVELAITLIVAAILFAVAIPSFNNIINSNRLTTATNSMVGALNNARMEAIKRNGSVQFCGSSATSNGADALGTACSTSTGAVLVLTGPATTATVLAPPSALSIASLKVRGTPAAIRFNGLGVGYAPSSPTTPFGATNPAGAPVVELCSTALRSNNDIIISMVAGSIISSSPPSTVTTCP